MVKTLRLSVNRTEEAAQSETLLSGSEFDPSSGAADRQCGVTNAAAKAAVLIIPALAVTGVLACASFAGSGRAADVRGAEPARRPPPANGSREQGLGAPFCGIATNPSHCERTISYLSTIDNNATANVTCKEFGGSDPCSVDEGWDVQEGLKKDPTACRVAPRVFFLWEIRDHMLDKPGFFGTPLCGGEGLPECALWAAVMWRKYADRWAAEIRSARRAERLRISSPQFQGRNVLEHFEAFFAACPECSQRTSRYYIDILAFSALCRAPGRDAGRLEGIARALKSRYGNRTVVLAKLGTLGLNSTREQADLIENTGLFDSGRSALDAVYYVSAADWAGDEVSLRQVVESGQQRGATLGQVLLDKCANHSETALAAGGDDPGRGGPQDAASQQLPPRLEFDKV